MLAPKPCLGEFSWMTHPWDEHHPLIIHIWDMNNVNGYITRNMYVYNYIYNIMISPIYIYLLLLIIIIIYYYYIQIWEYLRTHQHNEMGKRGLLGSFSWTKWVQFWFKTDSGYHEPQSVYINLHSSLKTTLNKVANMWCPKMWFIVCDATKYIWNSAYIRTHVET